MHQSTPVGAVIESAMQEIKFHRALHVTDWIKAERHLNDLAGLNTVMVILS